MLSEADKRAQARQEFDRRRRSHDDSTVTSGTNFDTWYTSFAAGEAGTYTTVDGEDS